MKIASFLLNGRQTYGMVSSDGVHPVLPEFAAHFADLRAVLTAQALLDLADACTNPALDPAAMQFLPPIPAPSKILCIGLNYRKPYPVAGAVVQSDDIVIFGRHDDTLVGHGMPLEMPVADAAQSFDFEGEIVAVIGRPCRHVTEADALSHVAGYACMNEGSVRGWQKHSVHAGKNFHASGAWGPWVTTADEAGPVEQMRLTTRVNGDVMQSATGADMIHPLPKLIAYLSHITRLNPGDVIATGSPDGTGGSRKPPAFLKPGDVVEIDIPNVGTLRNHVAEPAQT
ncbi:fumarylacetoacetate hydrolase family protein [Marivita sp.]|jgi:2-keto-4-pentenoate hydratase/2-oxohepta-3-ene-1,7-dioic acid hydratase in catechol pathway|uniref:fumarylacetoacetate hydrolase family protein n=1 Tax=Marivita sp. TaxID=2003365 RepID=UPI00321AE7D4